MNSTFTKWIKNPITINLIVIVVLACILIWGVLFWLKGYTRHNEAVVVPDVKGMELAEAAGFFTSNGLRYTVVDSVFAKNVPPGAIVELVPATGSKVKEGRIVFVTVNAMNSQTAVIPEVEDLSFRQAYALLKANGFQTIDTLYRPGEYRDLALGVRMNGRILNAGERVPLTARLQLLVSSGIKDEFNIDGDVEEINGSDEENWF